MGFTSELEVGARGARSAIVGGDDAEQADAGEAAGGAARICPRRSASSAPRPARWTRLINAILKLSREGRRELTPEPIDLGKLFAGDRGRACSTSSTRPAPTIAIDADRLPLIVSDRLALEQIFGNLVDNAVKYLAPRPARPRSRSSARASAPAGSASRSSDNGRGIAAQDHERIFELFRRSGAQDQPGEGIGLAHVRALVRRLGGDITVRSELGHGTTFQIDLPARPASVDTECHRA